MAFGSEAVAVVPRGKRADELLNVSCGTQSISPLLLGLKRSRKRRFHGEIRPKTWISRWKKGLERPILHGDGAEMHGS